MIVSPSQTTSIRFHWPAGTSTSSFPRKPTTSFQAGSRPHQLNRPRVADLDVGPPLLIIGLAFGPLARFAGEPGLAPPADHEEVAAASLDDLAFDRLHPAVARRPVGAHAVEQDARVACVLLARRPGLLPPSPLGDQMVVAEVAAGRQGPEFLAREMTTWPSFATTWTTRLGSSYPWSRVNT